MSSAPALDFVLSLQALKNSSKELMSLSFADRLKILENLKFQIENNMESWSSEIAQEENLPFDFVKQEIFMASVKYIGDFVSYEAEKKLSRLQPVGVVGISLPGLFSFRLALERFLPAWLAGNPVLLLFSEKSKKTSSIFSDFLQPVLPASWKILLGHKEEILPLLAAHPGISSFLFVGHERHRVALIQAAAPSGKRVQMSLSAKNSLIFLSPPRNEELFYEQLKSCFMGAGQSSFNSHRIFILDSFKEEFLLLLKKTLEKYNPVLQLQSEARVKRLLQIKSGIMNEQGQIFWGGESVSENSVTPLFSVDLSNCSVWQQEDLQVPFFIISSVKYSHEIARWTNTGNYGHSAVIYGDEAKARGLAEKLSVGLVQINQWHLPWSKTFRPQRLSSYNWSSLSCDDYLFSDIQRCTAL